ncbi:MAG TPA: zinc-dependent alcohol dehydrogenase family protein [Azospirillum sp.]|nr:zinc-dependent alcohol dehydrogenase family protein [Azospirillum sp.]
MARAIRYDRFGEPTEVLRLHELPDAEPGPGEVLVRMTARSVNPSDLLTIRGTYAQHTPLPSTPGWEGVGTVVAAGPGASADLVGKRVLPLRGAGTWQELVTAPAAWAVPVPAGIADGMAAQLYINPVAVWLMLTEELRLAPGDVLLVNAAGSACGRIAAQLCRERGLRMVGIVRSDAYTDELRALGAAAVVNTAREPVGPVVARLTEGRGAAAALDAVGGAAGAALLDHLAPGGALLAYGLLSGALLRPDAAELARRGLTARDYWLRRWVERCTPEAWHTAFAAIMERVANGRLVLPVAAAYDLADVAQAVRAAEASGRSGKILLAG